MSFDLSSIKSEICKVKNSKCCDSSSSHKEDTSSSCCPHNESEDHTFMDIPISIQKRVHALENIQAERVTLSSELQHAIVMLQRSFEEKFNAIDKKRSSIVSGDREPTAEELESFAPLSAITSVTEINEKEEFDDIKGIPCYWSTILINHPKISEIVQQHDQDALEYLEDIQSSFLEGDNECVASYTITFRFAPNPYFTNECLVKTYYMESAPPASEGGNPLQRDYNFFHSVGTEINWKEDKDLCNVTKIRTQRHRTDNTVRRIKREEKQESFFWFFKPTKQEDVLSAIARLETADNEDDFATIKEEIEIYDEAMQIDFENGECLREEIIPASVDWFTGRALEYTNEDEENEDGEGEYSDSEGEYSESDKEEEDEEDNDSEEDDESDSDSEDNESSDSSAAPSSSEKPADCKQQ